MNLDAMRSELIRDEAMKLKPYRDSVGKLSIGVGRNLDDVGISQIEAAQMLDSDIRRTADALDKALPWWRGLDEVRQRVLLNMAFNMGVAGLLGFKHTLADVQAGNYDFAAAGMLASKWAGQVGDRAQRLANMMMKGNDHA